MIRKLRHAAKFGASLGASSHSQVEQAAPQDACQPKRGMPNPLRLPVIANEHFDLVRLPYVPAAMQKAALVVGAAIGRAAGYEPEYVPIGEPALAI